MSSSKTAITPSRAENFAEWYQAVIRGADMAETSPVRGCMIIKPWGYALWEKMQSVLDKKFKETGHENAYFPLLIPLSYMEKEAEHVEGFAKECAVVTHHRLEDNGEGGLKPAGKLDEPYIIRPTSEMIIGDAFAKWTHSYRDLPLLINQWANVMRWEMRTRLFLRTSEFLWQEGHTAHATAQEAKEETAQMLQVYKWFLEEYLAMPVFDGEKTPEEKFPGAEHTYTVEAMMQNKKALQAGTSHYMGQNFAKSCGIEFTNSRGEQEFAYTTSWGVSTRMIGGLIMSHSDDDGLVLPPKIAPKHVVLLPLLGKGNDEAVLDATYTLKKKIEEELFDGENIEVIIDQSEKYQKKWDWVRKGIPIRIEIGPRDVEKGTAVVFRRDKPAHEKEFVEMEKIPEKVSEILPEMQNNMFSAAKVFRDNNVTEVSSLDEFKEHFLSNPDAGFALCFSDPEVNEEREQLLKQLKITARCIPFAFNQNNAESVCIFTGKPTRTKIIYAKAY